MKALRAAVREVVGLFVADWWQTLVIVLILGAGWPFWLGGITPYLDREGYSETVRGKRFLPLGVASLPA